MLTDAQINNIHKLDAQTLLQIMHECAEALGCVSVKDYCDILNMPRRTVYKYMEDGKLMFLNISDHKFPIINDNK